MRPAFPCICGEKKNCADCKPFSLQCVIFFSSGTPTESNWRRLARADQRCTLIQYRLGPERCWFWKSREYFSLTHPTPAQNGRDLWHKQLSIRNFFLNYPPTSYHATLYDRSYRCVNSPARAKFMRICPGPFPHACEVWDARRRGNAPMALLLAIGQAELESSRLPGCRARWPGSVVSIRRRQRSRIL